VGSWTCETPNARIVVYEPSHLNGGRIVRRSRESVKILSAPTDKLSNSTPIEAVSAMRTKARCVGRLHAKNQQPGCRPRLLKAFTEMYITGGSNCGAEVAMLNATSATRRQTHQTPPIEASGARVAYR
jgi:hypothetical protein